ncbi:MAG: PspA/IM30 family protein [Candidatus Zixiibacteriota bacterium]
MLRILSGIVVGGVLGWAVAQFWKEETTSGYVDVNLLGDSLEEKFAKLELEDYVEKELAELRGKMAK